MSLYFRITTLLSIIFPFALWVIAFAYKFYFIIAVFTTENVTGWGWGGVGWGGVGWGGVGWGGVGWGGVGWGGVGWGGVGWGGVGWGGVGWGGVGWGGVGWGRRISVAGVTHKRVGITPSICR